MTDQLASSAPTSSDQEAAATVWAKTRHGFSQGTWSLRRRLALAFVVAGVLLPIGSVLGALALNSLVSAVNVQVNRLDPAARNTSYLLASLLNEETGVRGYVLTARAVVPQAVPARGGGDGRPHPGRCTGSSIPILTCSPGCGPWRLPPVSGAPSTPNPPSPAGKNGGPVSIRLRDHGQERLRSDPREDRRPQHRRYSPSGGRP